MFKVLCIDALAGGLSGRAIAGIVVGVTIPFVPICILVVYCIHRRRKRGRFIPKQISMKKVSNAHKIKYLGVMHSAFTTSQSALWNVESHGSLYQHFKCTYNPPSPMYCTVCTLSKNYIITVYVIGTRAPYFRAGSGKYYNTAV